MAGKPVVRLVTPANPMDHNKSHDTLEDVLNKLLGSTISYKVYYGMYDPARLETAARKAVADAIDARTSQPPQRAVIVAAGTMTTNIVQQKRAARTDIPIIQAAGGNLPDLPRTNITGFLINVLDTALDNFRRLTGSDPVAVLYDNTPPIPPAASTIYIDVYNALQAEAVRKSTTNPFDSSNSGRPESTRSPNGRESCVLFIWWSQRVDATLYLRRKRWSGC